jgi:hypothetical protein
MKRITIILDDDFYEIIRTEAFNKRTTVSELSRNALKFLLEKSSVGKIKKSVIEPKEESSSVDCIEEPSFDVFIKKMWALNVPDPKKYNADKLGRIRREFESLWKDCKTVLPIDVSHI